MECLVTLESSFLFLASSSSSVLLLVLGSATCTSENEDTLNHLKINTSTTYSNANAKTISFPVTPKVDNKEAKCMQETEGSQDVLIVVNRVFPIRLLG